MYRVKAPLRVSFFGGGSDYPSFLEKSNGCVFGCSVNLYCQWEAIKCVNSPSSDNFARAIVNFLEHKMDKSYSLATNSDQFINSGLGASSASLNALIALYDKISNSEKDLNHLIESVLKVERDYFNKTIGMQDPILSAYGGLNLVEFNGKRFTVKNVKNEELIADINKNLYLIKVTTRKKQQETIKSYTTRSDTFPIISELASLAREVGTKSQSNLSIIEFSSYLKESWRLKRELSPLITSSEIDLIVDELLLRGALGVKLLGAGGGGVLAALIPEFAINSIKCHFRNLNFLKVEIENKGVHLCSTEA